MNKEMLSYILYLFAFDIDNLVYEVLNDSVGDPHFSAVTATNMIKCYIQVKNDLDEELPYKDVKGYFNNNSYTKDEYLLFENKRIIESEYYIGEQ